MKSSAYRTMIMSPLASRRRPLSGPSVTGAHDSVFQDASLEPFLDQPDDAPVADPMFQETNQPFLADLVEVVREVGVNDFRVASV